MALKPGLFVCFLLYSSEWLRRCATSRTVPGSIPGGVTAFFTDIFPSDRSMALGSTQPLVQMSTRNIPWGNGGRCVRLTTSPPSCAECHEIWEPKPPGTLWATPGLLRGCCTFTFLLFRVLAISAELNGTRVFYIQRNSVTWKITVQYIHRLEGKRQLVLYGCEAWSVSLMK